MNLIEPEDPEFMICPYSPSLLSDLPDDMTKLKLLDNIHKVICETREYYKSRGDKNFIVLNIRDFTDISYSFEFVTLDEFIEQAPQAFPDDPDIIETVKYALLEINGVLVVDYFYHSHRPSCYEFVLCDLEVELYSDGLVFRN